MVTNTKLCERGCNTIPRNLIIKILKIYFAKECILGMCMHRGHMATRRVDVPIDIWKFYPRTNLANKLITQIATLFTGAVNMFFRVFGVGVIEKLNRHS